MLEQHQWKHFGRQFQDSRKKKDVWVDGIMKKDTLRNVIHIFSYSSIIYWLCQDRITPPPPKLIQGLWENPWHRVCWEIGKVQICLSVILNHWTSPNLPLLFFLFSSHPACGHKFNAVTTRIAVQWEQSYCANWMSKTTFLSWSVSIVFFFFWMTVKMLNYYTLQHQCWFISQFASERLPDQF